MTTTVTITIVNGVAGAAQVDATTALAIAKDAAQHVDRTLGPLAGASSVSVSIT